MVKAIRIMIIVSAASAFVLVLVTIAALLPRLWSPHLISAKDGTPVDHTDRVFNTLICLLDLSVSGVALLGGWLVYRCAKSRAMDRITSVSYGAVSALATIVLSIGSRLWPDWDAITAGIAPLERWEAMIAIPLLVIGWLAGIVLPPALLVSYIKTRNLPMHDMDAPT